MTVNIPLPNISDDEQIDIEVSIGKKKKRQYFRLESVSLDLNSSDEKSIEKELSSSEKIERLKKVIENYDKNWELIQIFAPLKKSFNIHILYRKI